MMEFERAVWSLVYAVALTKDFENPEVFADQAVIELQKAEQRFSNDFPQPPEEIPDTWDPDVPF